MGKYRDTRQEFWRSQFDAAKPMAPYLADGKDTHRAKWEAMAGRIALGDEQRQRAASFVRTMPALCLSGIWCGDCVRQGPILEAIAAASAGVDLRFVERVEDELAEELRINGALKVPVVVLLSEDFYELARIGDRMLSTYRKKAQRELGPTCEWAWCRRRPRSWRSRSTSGWTSSSGRSGSCACRRSCASAYEATDPGRSIARRWSRRTRRGRCWSGTGRRATGPTA